MTAVKIFCDEYLKIIKNLRVMFDDDLHVKREYEYINNTLASDNGLDILHDRFQNSVNQEMIDRIFKQDITIFQSDVYILGYVDLYTLKPRFQTIEKLNIDEMSEFWKCLGALCKYSSMVRACGGKMNEIEGIAKDFLKSNPDITAEDCHSKLISEMLSGGDMSQKLMSAFSGPDMMQNVIKNITNIMGPNENTDFSSLFESLEGDRKVEDISPKT